MVPPLDDERFAEVFRDRYPRLVGLSRRVLGDADEAEDAARDALLALRFAGTAAPGGPFVRWSLADAAGWGLLADRWFRRRDL